MDGTLQYKGLAATGKEVEFGRWTTVWETGKEGKVTSQIKGWSRIILVELGRK
jgi:hypothetical protein